MQIIKLNYLILLIIKLHYLILLTQKKESDLSHSSPLPDKLDFWFEFFATTFFSVNLLA